MEYQLRDIPVSLAAHPNTSVLAVGCIDQHLELFTVAFENTYESCTSLEHASKKTRLEEFPELPAQSSSSTTTSKIALKSAWSATQKSPIRKILFSPDGSTLYSVTRNKTLSVFDVATGRKTRVVRQLMEKGIRPYCATTVGQHQLCIGDEAGALTVLDWRCQNHASLIVARVAQDSESDDHGSRHLTDVLAADQSKARGLVLTTRADGVLLAADLRKKTFVMESEPMHDELLCMAVMKNGRKLLCGSGDGHVEVFNFGEWGNLVERMDTGHSEAVEVMCPLNDDLLVTGSSDGTVKLHHVLPNRLLRNIGGRRGAAGVEALALCQAGNWLVSADQDSKLNFHTTSELVDLAPKTKSGAEMKKLAKHLSADQSNFLAGLIEKESDEEESEIEGAEEHDTDSSDFDSDDSTD